jgi:hypothetical protein
MAACQSPEKKFATELGRIEGLRQKLHHMSMLLAIDDSMIMDRSRRIRAQDSLSLEQSLSPELLLSLKQYEAIPVIYENYLGQRLRIRRQRDSLSQALEGMQQRLFSGEMGRRLFRDQFLEEARAVGSLQKQVEETAGKVIAVEPVYRRIQPYIDSLGTSVKPGP